MTIRLGKVGRGLAVFTALLILFGGILLFLFWAIGTSPSTEQSNRNAPRVGSPNANQEEELSKKKSVAEIAQSLSQTIGEIKAARDTAINIRDDPRQGFMKEACPAVDALVKRDGNISTAQRVAAAREGNCDRYLEKFYAYYDNLEQLVAQQPRQLSQAESQVASLNTLLPDESQGDSPTNSISWPALLWITAASIIAPLIVFSLVAVEHFSSRRDITAALSQGFSTVNSSLGHLHQVLSLPVQSGLVVRGAEVFGQERTASDTKQEDQRFKQFLSAFSSELNQGFLKLQKSFESILKSLDTIGLRLESPSERTQSRPPAQQSGAADIQPSPPSPPPSSHQDEDDDPVLPPPMFVSIYKTKFNLMDGVGASYQPGYLEKKQEGELSVFADKQGKIYYLIPNDKYLQTPSYFHQKYAAYYESPDIQAGYIEITAPAVVQREGELWRLKRKGTLTTQRTRD
jgi:hypothetical protein